VLKFAFWSLLALNALLFAYSQGLLGHAGGGEHEPARLKNQINGDKLKLVPPPAPAMAQAEAPAADPAPAAQSTPIACLEVGSFAAPEARRFETRLAALQLGGRMSRTTIGGTDPTSWIVHIPPQASKEAAEKKAGELKSLGVSDFFIMNDATPMKNAISLGVFKSEALAQALLASLVKQGVHSARVSPRGGVPARTAYQFRGIDGAQRARIDDIAGSFQAVDSKACK
jgi:hypothetical protein